jgi:hypothetical protein
MNYVFEIHGEFEAEDGHAALRQLGAFVDLIEPALTGPPQATASRGGVVAEDAKARDEIEAAAWPVIEAARELGRTLAKHEPVEREWVRITPEGDFEGGGSGCGGGAS